MAYLTLLRLFIFNIYYYSICCPFFYYISESYYVCNMNLCNYSIKFGL